MNIPLMLFVTEKKKRSLWLTAVNPAVKVVKMNCDGGKSQKCVDADVQLEAKFGLSDVCFYYLQTCSFCSATLLSYKY